MKRIFKEMVNYYTPLLSGIEVKEVEDMVFNHRKNLTSVSSEETRELLVDTVASIVAPSKTSTISKEVKFEDIDGKSFIKVVDVKFTLNEDFKRVVVKRKSKKFPDGIYLEETDVLQEQEAFKVA